MKKVPLIFAALFLLALAAMPMNVMADPVCGNEEVEDGEDCDLAVLPGLSEDCAAGEICDDSCACVAEECDDGVLSPSEPCEVDPVTACGDVTTECVNDTDVCKCMQLGSIAESVDHKVGDLWEVTLVVTTDAEDGAFATKLLTKTYAGFLYAFSVAPGSPAPTDNSDLQVFQTMNGVATATDALATQGTNMIDNATPNLVKLTTEAPVAGPLAIAVTNNIVPSAGFILRLYFRIPGTN